MLYEESRWSRRTLAVDGVAEDVVVDGGHRADGGEDGGEDDGELHDAEIWRAGADAADYCGRLAWGSLGLRMSRGDSLFIYMFRKHIRLRSPSESGHTTHRRIRANLCALVKSERCVHLRTGDNFRRESLADSAGHMIIKDSGIPPLGQHV